jgi:FHS family L-fucose permease-like MFS transporter
LQNPMGVIVKNQFGASNAMSQLGNLANFIAYAFMGIPAGIILERKGYKFTALSAVAVGFVGVLITFLSGQLASFGVYLTGAFISGFSMCMLNTVVNPMLNTLGGGGNKGNQLIQFGGAINSIGATIVPVLVGYLIGDVSQATISNANPALYLAMGIFAFAFIVLLVVDIPEPRLGLNINKKKTKDKHSALSFRHFVLGIIAIFIYVGVEVGIPNIANLYMTTSPTANGLGIAAGIAGSIVGVYWLLMLFGRLIGGKIPICIQFKNMISDIRISCSRKIEV